MIRKEKNKGTSVIRKAADYGLHKKERKEKRE